MVRIDEELTDAAARIDPESIQTLDALHMAAAETLRDELTAVVTYDHRMQEAAIALGLEVATPGSRL